MIRNNYLTRLIFKLLSENYAFRDDYLLLIKAIHDSEMELQGFERTEYYFLFFSDRLSNINTIVRIWRLVQEKCPHLRGRDWEERQVHSGLIRSEIAENNFISKQLDLFS